MRFARFLIPIALLSSAASAQTTLDCPGSSSAGAHCDTFHYHEQMYRPDTRGFAEVWGINQFSSQVGCEHARDAAMKRNLAVVDWFKRVRGDAQYEPDRFGPCHCDLTLDKTNPRYLTDAQRAAQLNLAESARAHVREKLMDAGIATDSEIYHDVAAPPAPIPSLVASPKLVPLPQGGLVAQVANNAADLKTTRTVDTSKPSVAVMDVPLVDVPLTGGTTAAPPPTTVVTNETVTPETAPVPVTASDAADKFIPYETQRVQNVIKATDGMTDDALKSQIYEACSQRSQLLSNLRSLIEGSGARSRLADFARTSASEDERVAFAGKLFGDDVKPHWAPRDAKDIVIDAQPDIDTDPERVMHDTSGKFSTQQRKRAFYILLSRSQPTEQQQLWLTTVADSFLQ
jgi:hypothetical protein